jgi:hypothetical protein
MDIKSYPNHYKIDNVKYDRVTSVLGYFMPRPLLDWALREGAKEYKNKTKTAKAIGTRVDKIATAILANTHWCITDKDHPAIRNCVGAFKNWLNEEKPKVIDWQITVRDNELMVAGTYDLSLEDTLIDIKCANRISLSYWIQLATYAKLSGKGFKKLAVLRLDKLTGDYQYKVIDYTDDLYNLFLCMLNYYRFENIYDKKEEEVDDGKRIEVATGEIQKKFGIFSPEIKSDWSKFHNEI